ncbi:MAG: hypothetical protein R3293_00940 [Candidatus Promineifilaceae bacterium]|nr:hypothetical protein [Candidatus Promineifilaceae bacterium]
MLVVGRHLIGVRRATWIALAGIAIYSIFVGTQASVVCAAVIGALTIITTRIMGRPIFLPAAICTAATIMTLVNRRLCRKSTVCSIPLLMLQSRQKNLF